MLLWRFSHVVDLRNCSSIPGYTSKRAYLFIAYAPLLCWSPPLLGFTPFIFFPLCDLWGSTYCPVSFPLGQPRWRFSKRICCTIKHGKVFYILNESSSTFVAQIHLLPTLRLPGLYNPWMVLATLEAYMEAVSCGFLVVFIELFYKWDDLLHLELGELLYVYDIQFILFFSVLTRHRTGKGFISKTHRFKTIAKKWATDK